MVVCCVANRLA